MLLEMRNINKSFPGVLANVDVDFDVREGEIHTLLGENGAGKTTLMNILYGLYSADSGTITWKGKPLQASSTHDAIEQGIGMIHQHFMLIPKFTVVENIILGTWKGPNPALVLKGAAERIKAISKQYHLEVDPWALVENLSVGEQQRVEIIKALYREVKLLIMDEPTAVLAPQEVEELFQVLNQLRKENRSIIFISHKLDEVLRISNRITILRDGQKIATVENTPDLDRAKLAFMMVGREISLKIEKPQRSIGDTVLEIENLTTVKNTSHKNVKDIQLKIHRGEIFGIAGVDGNGQEELAAALMGLEKVQSGKIAIMGKDTTHWSTHQIRRLPIAYIPEDRHNVGLVMDFCVRDNLVVNKVEIQPYGSATRLYLTKMTENARRLIKQFNISVPSPVTMVNKLSGGNQQKVVLARETGQEVDLIIAVQPTRGLDVDATRFVFDTMLEARRRGAAVLYISTELEEILGLSDTIGVLYNGELIGKMPIEQASLQQLGLLIAGERLGEGAGVSA